MCTDVTTERGRRAAIAGPVLLALLTLGVWLSSSSCSHVDGRVEQENLRHRAEVDSFFRYDAGSPFRRDTTIRYHGINWFPVDPRYCVESVLYRYRTPDTVSIMGTKGEERRELRYGYFEVALPGSRGSDTVVRINVYKFTPYDGQRYLLYKDILSVWFTDLTTGKETYPVGRYLDMGAEDPDTTHRYTVDFNKAYNPYCAYSAMYSCAIPPREDHLNLALRVGEKKYHE